MTKEIRGFRAPHKWECFTLPVCDGRDSSVEVQSVRVRTAISVIRSLRRSQRVFSPSIGVVFRTDARQYSRQDKNYFNKFSTSQKV